MLFSVVHLALEGAVYYATVPAAWRGTRSVGEQVAFFLNAFLMTDLLTYGAVVGCWFALEYHRRPSGYEVLPPLAHEAGVRGTEA